jgi:2-oxo-4-hydroxy-4-carboxy-5-ureidoimidazoline decarboxylase
LRLHYRAREADIMLSVQEFNRLAAEAARQALRRCCSSGRWVDAVLGGRPYADVGALLAASDSAVAALSTTDLREALEGHPRIGERRAATLGEPESAGWSRQEQAGVTAAAEDLKRALADGNAAYEERFGHIYLACATGRDAGQLLAFLRSRLGNDHEMEWGVVASELAKINQIRLRKLLDGDATAAVATGTGGTDERLS